MNAFRLRVAPILALIAACPALSHAQTKPRPREFSADVGFVNTAGNTDITTFNLGEKLIVRTGKWEFKQQMGSVYGKQNGERTSNLLFVNGRGDLSLNKWLGLFGLVGFDRNTFAGISRHFEEAAGLAARILNSDTDQWNAELGLSLNQQRSSIDGSDQSFTALRTGTSYRHNFSKASYVYQALEYLPSFKVSEDYRINSETGFVAPLSTHASMKFAYVVRFDNLPEPGKKRSDRILTSGLQFNW